MIFPLQGKRRVEITKAYSIKLTPKRYLAHDGFTLIEILVALTLAALAITLVVSDSSSTPHSKIERTFDNFERAVRFSRDEAVLRNRIIRLLIVIGEDDEESSFSVEYGPDKDFVIPTQFLKDIDNDSSLDEDEIIARKKKLSGEFNKVQEFQEKPEPIDDQVSIIGVGSTLFSTFISEGEASIFFYPTGEKDGAFIVIGNEEEVSTLSIEPFTMDFKRNYRPIDNSENIEDLFEFHTAQGRKLYQEWVK